MCIVLQKGRLNKDFLHNLAMWLKIFLAKDDDDDGDEDGDEEQVDAFEIGGGGVIM